MAEKRCSKCGEVKPATTEFFHKHPEGKFGNDRTNLQILCKPCNLKKNAKDPIRFAQEIGLLL